MSRSFTRLGRTAKFALIVGVLGGLIGLVALFARMSRTGNDMDPFPTFGADFHAVWIVAGVFYAGLWLTATVMTFRSSRDPGEATSWIPWFLLTGVVAGLLWMGVCVAVPVLNAVLDFSTPVETPIYVHHASTSMQSSRGRYSLSVAKISRMDHPQERIKINWDTCGLPDDEPLSPFATLRIGKGAFGVPWIDLPVSCRGLAVRDRPLARDLYVGRGEPVVLFTLPECQEKSPADVAKKQEQLAHLEDRIYDLINGYVNDLAVESTTEYAEWLVSADGLNELGKILTRFEKGSRAERQALAAQAKALVRDDMARHDPEVTLPQWTSLVREANAKVPIVWVTPCKTPAFIKALAPSFVRVVPDPDFNQHVLDLIFKPAKTWDDDLVTVVDGRGVRVFSAHLPELGRRQELAAALSGPHN
jgi:hypothetical protein